QGAFAGLKHVWEACYVKVILRIDSTTAIVVVSEDGTSHKHGIEVIQFHYLRRRKWNLLNEHTYVRKEITRQIFLLALDMVIRLDGT
ncbi:hypothetical protein LINPERHAP1_LOCUS35015, partial [Linum perenne]